MGQFDMQLGPSLSDLMTQKAMQQAQIKQAGQQSQLSGLQLQEAQQGQTFCRLLVGGQLRPRLVTPQFR